MHPLPSFHDLALPAPPLHLPFVSGIFGLGRKFRIMDDDGSKTVSFPEFTKALRETGVIIDESSARKLFQVCPRVCRAVQLL